MSQLPRRSHYREGADWRVLRRARRRLSAEGESLEFGVLTCDLDVPLVVNPSKSPAEEGAAVAFRRYEPRQFFRDSRLVTKRSVSFPSAKWRPTEAIETTRLHSSNRRIPSLGPSVHAMGSI